MKCWQNQKLPPSQCCQQRRNSQHWAQKVSVKYSAGEMSHVTDIQADLALLGWFPDGNIWLLEHQAHYHPSWRPSHSALLFWKSPFRKHTFWIGFLYRILLRMKISMPDDTSILSTWQFYLSSKIKSLASYLIKGELVLGAVFPPSYWQSSFWTAELKATLQMWEPCQPQPSAVSAPGPYLLPQLETTFAGWLFLLSLYLLYSSVRVHVICSFMFLRHGSTHYLISSWGSVNSNKTTRPQWLLSLHCGWNWHWDRKHCGHCYQWRQGIPPPHSHRSVGNKIRHALTIYANPHTWHQVCVFWSFSATGPIVDTRIFMSFFMC